MLLLRLMWLLLPMLLLLLLLLLPLMLVVLLALANPARDALFGGMVSGRALTGIIGVAAVAAVARAQAR